MLCFKDAKIPRIKIMVVMADAGLRYAKNGMISETSTAIWEIGHQSVRWIGLTTMALIVQQIASGQHKKNNVTIRE
jgi:hypothetical protein